MRLCRRFFAWGSAAALFSLLVCPGVLEGRPAVMREIRVGVAVEASYKQIPEWKSKFEKRLAYTSKIFEREFKIRIKPAAYFPWTPSSPQSGMSFLVQDLMNQFPLKSKGVDIIVGLTRLKNISGSLNIQDVDVLGLSRPFAGYMVLRYPDNPLFRIQEETVLTHELGHLFGAVHTHAPDTIMAPVVGRHIPTSFDSENRGIIQVARNYNFREGTDAMNSDMVRRLLASYQKFIRTEQPAEFHYALAVFYLKLGRSEDALRTFQRLVALNPDDPQGHYDLGILYARLGQAEKARKELNLAIHQMDSPVYDRNKAAAFNLLGGIYFQEQNIEGAHYAWSKAAKMAPDNKDIQVNLASVQIKRGQTGEAIRTLNRILSEDRQNPKILNNLGMAYYEKGDYKTAVGYFRDVLRIIEDKKQAPRPMTPFEVLNPAEIYILVGNAYWQMGEKKQALQFFQYSCTLEDSTSCHERIGKIYFDLGEWDACIGELVKVVQVKKDDPDIYGALGVALYRMNQPDKALAVFREGLLNIEDKKKASVLHQNLGHMYLQLQQPDQAISEFQLALASDWNNIGAHYGIAVAYMAQGQIDYAVGAVKTFEALAPQHEGVKKLKEQIEIMVTQMRAQSEAEMRQRMNLR